MSFESDAQKNAVIGIIGAAIFAILTILFPLLKVLGGFLTYSVTEDFLGQQITSSLDYYWDEITGSALGISIDISYDQYVQQDDLSAEFIWQIIPLWGLIWILAGLIGTILVIIPAFQALSGQEPIDVAKIGLIIGIVATGVEYGLFILALFLEEWETTEPNLNIMLLGCFIIGWIALIVGYSYTMKTLEREDYTPISRRPTYARRPTQLLQDPKRVSVRSLTSQELEGITQMILELEERSKMLDFSNAKVKKWIEWFKRQTDKYNVGELTPESFYSVLQRYQKFLDEHSSGI